jgi:hypothetical protein
MLDWTLGAPAPGFEWLLPEEQDAAAKAIRKAQQRLRGIGCEISMGGIAFVAVEIEPHP